MLSKVLNRLNIGTFLMLVLIVIILIDLVFYGKKDEIEKFEEQTGDKYSIYQMIISTFNTILSRNPNTSELFKYYNKMNDEKLNASKLQTILTNTDEYKRTEAIQNNMTNLDTVNLVNTQQVDADILEVYGSLFNKNPDDITLQYFRKKYTELDLNKDELKNYMMHTPDYQKYNKLIVETELEIKKESDKANLAANTEANKKFVSLVDKATVPTVNALSGVPVEKPVLYTDGQKSLTINRPNIYNFIGKDGTTEQDVIDKSSALVGSRITKTTDGVTEDNIDTQQECTSVPSIRNKWGRDLDEMKYTCLGKKKYVNADNFGKLMPEFEWMVPERMQPICYGAKFSANPTNSQTALIGTLLDDSKKTQVGSIMPKFNYTNVYETQ